MSYEYVSLTQDNEGQLAAVPSYHFPYTIYLLSPFIISVSFSLFQSSYKISLRHTVRSEVQRETALSFWHSGGSELLHIHTENHGLLCVIYLRKHTLSHFVIPKLILTN